MDPVGHPVILRRRNGTVRAAAQRVRGVGQAAGTAAGAQPRTNA